MLPIAIGGSAANPTTMGHFKIVEWLLNSGKFSVVIWILSGDRVDKKNLISPEDRIALTLLTFPPEWFLKKDVKFIISFEDVYGKNMPTFEWIEKVKKIYPDRKIVWYTGVDLVIPQEQYGNKSEIEAKWINGEDLYKNANFLVFSRGGYFDPCKLSLPKNFEIVKEEFPEISSSEVRRRIEKKENFNDLVSLLAAKYIKENNLYLSK